MKFKVGDKVQTTDKCKGMIAGTLVEVIKVDDSDPTHKVRVHKPGSGGGTLHWLRGDWVQPISDPTNNQGIPQQLQKETNPKDGGMRKFESGATRDTAEGKLSYRKALSPIVLRRYVQYLAKHRKQPDGSMREFDNWKKGIDFDVYLDSLLRHNMDLEIVCEGFPAADNHGPCGIEDLLCAIIFNASGALYELLKKRLPKVYSKPVMMGDDI